MTPASPAPHDQAAEEALLGALLISPRGVMEAVGELDPEDFYVPAHRIIFRAISDYLAENPNEDPRDGMALLISGVLRDQGQLEEVGGGPALTALQTNCPSRTGAAGYANRIRLEAGQFKLLQAAKEQAQDAKERKPLLDSLAAARGRLDDIVRHTDLGRSLRTPDATINAFLELKEEREVGGISGIPSGFDKLDKITGGARPGDSWVLGGRTGQGKTTLGLALALAALQAGHPTVIVSLEMAETQLTERVMASMADILHTRLRDISPDQRLSQGEEQRLIAAQNEYLSYPVTIHDDPDTTVSRIEGLARIRGIGKGKGLIVIDYLQLLEGEPGVRHGTRTEYLAAISRGLKRLARNLECVVLSLVQLLDAPDGLNPVPVLSDTRECKAINHDASVVLMVHRPYAGEEVDPGDFHIYVRKNRHGVSDRRVELIFNAPKMRFSAPPPGLRPVGDRPPPTYKFGSGSSSTGSSTGGGGAARADALKQKQEQENVKFLRPQNND